MLLLYAATGLTTKPARWRTFATDEPLVAATLGELMLRERLAVKEAQGRPQVVALDRMSTSDDLLDDVLGRVADAPPHDCEHWLRHLRSGTERAYCDRFIERELVRRRSRRRDRDPVADPELVVTVRRRISATVQDVGAASLRDVAFVALLAAADNVLFSRVGGQPPRARRGPIAAIREDRRFRNAVRNRVHAWGRSPAALVGGVDRRPAAASINALADAARQRREAAQSGGL